MTAIPEPQNSLVALIDRAIESQQEPPRPHLGASLLGHPCDRWLWLSFRWAVVDKHSGRILRLFDRGQREEERVIRNLRDAGVDVRVMGQQMRVDFGSHVSGSLDGIIDSGVPEAPKSKHILEIKTHSLKLFNDLIKKGVEKSKPMHWVQMQVYMLGAELDRALYYAVCKDNDSIYTERVRLDKTAAQKYIDRGKRIALTERMPPPLSIDPSWYQCSYCPAREFCHETKLTKKVSCRTCAHSTPLDNSSWRCERYQSDDIPVSFQRTGCPAHVLHPDLVPWPMAEGKDEWTAVYIIDGKHIANGEPGPHVYASTELVSNLPACLSGDKNIALLRDELDGRIAG